MQIVACLPDNCEQSWCILIVIAIESRKTSFFQNQAFILLHFDQSTHRLIRLTSPKLNYMIGAGAVLLYLGICVMVIPTTDQTTVTVLCNVS